MKLKACRICKNPNIKKFFDLGDQPLANSLPSKKNAVEKNYPLFLCYCENCHLVQLGYTADPKKLFSHYLWVTGTSVAARTYAEYFTNQLIARTPNAKKGYVLEIASNDGTFLLPFMRKGYKVLGIDPARNLAREANKHGIPTWPEYWNIKTAQKLIRQRGPARMVFARNVMFHVANIEEFVAGLALSVEENGVIAIEAHYAKIVQEQLHYDSIYHEHLFYYSIESTERLLTMHGLHLFDIGKSPISGGSIVVYVSRTPRPQSAAVREYKRAEARAKTNDFKTWQAFAGKAMTHRKELTNMIRTMRNRGVQVVGWGASARSSTMLNFARINSNLISAIADLNPLKQGRYTAGTHIPIKHPDTIMAEKPGCVVILAWNFAEEIMGALKKKYNYKGRVIIPLPNKPRMVLLT